MEFRRRTRRRRSASGDGGGTAKAIIVLLVVAAVVYLISASAAGTWIAQQVLAPAFTAFDDFLQGAAAAKTPEAANTASPQASSIVSADTVTGEIQLPAMECFALQMGVYSNEANADAQATALQHRGAGGYVMEDGGRYRVLAAAYSAEESLKQVREQLTAEGLESAVYVFPAPDSTLRVTASQAQLDGIAAGFSALDALQRDMASASLTFDQQQQSVQTGRDTAAALLTRLRDASTAFLAAASADNAVLQATKDCFDAYDEALSVLAEYKTESFVDFSSKMKYTHICMAHAYARLAQQVSNMA